MPESTQKTSATYHNRNVREGCWICRWYSIDYECACFRSSICYWPQCRCFSLF